MNYEIVKLPEMMVAGIDIYTSNKKEFSGEGKIPELWNRFFKESVFDKIPNKKNPAAVLAVYTDIETDENGPYRFVLGTEVTGFKGLPDEYYKKIIPAAEYIRQKTERGEFSSVGIECWKKIWSDKKLKTRRAYSSDLEIYDINDLNPGNTQFSIYVGVKGGLR